MKIALIQMPVSACKKTNIETARSYLRQAAEAGVQMAVLPEMFCCSYTNSAFVENAEPVGGMVWTAMSEAAKEFGLWLVAGSMPEQDGEKICNTSFVFDSEGNQIGKDTSIYNGDSIRITDVKAGDVFTICLVYNGKTMEYAISFT